jgi:hypothetical protein
LFNVFDRNVVAVSGRRGHSYLSTNIYYVLTRIVPLTLHETEKGDFLDKIGNYKLAIVYYDKALAIDPTLMQ